MYRYRKSLNAPPLARGGGTRVRDRAARPRVYIYNCTFCGTMVAGGSMYGEEHLMAITEGTLLEIAVRQTAYQQQVLNVWTYEVTGTFDGISAGAVANAYWQVVKDVYRGALSSQYNPTFVDVVVRQLDDPLGALGSYAIPEAERAGTRDAGGGDLAPAFIATGVRLVVGTRATRGGQKRIGGLLESDFSNGVLSAGVIAAVSALMEVAAVGTLTLGPPALGMDLLPIIVRRDPVTGLPVAYQPIVGYSISNQVTTQNTRKIGRGV